MKKLFTYSLVLLLASGAFAQTDPEITSWLRNTTGITGRHYVSGNPTPINDTAAANVQTVRYSDDYVYINASGIPAYIVGPYLDGNPSLATNNAWLFQIDRNPTENTGAPTVTPLGAVAVFINGVPAYDYKDAASYNSNTNMDDMMNGDGVWNRNAILAENDGFDCAKGHPSPIFSGGGGGGGGSLEGGSYHHHQNPSAFNMDLVEVSDICDTYLADGLYTLNSNEHSPLIGYAFDGFPIYGAYGYSDPNDANSPLQLIKSSYQERNITVREEYADGSDVIDGPPVSAQFPLGWYREDYEFIANSGDLDEHNGRFCVTPEYPEGTYAYFATVDDNWNSAYPYLVGPTYYGVVLTANFTSGGGQSTVVNEAVTEYTGMNDTTDTTSGIQSLGVEGMSINVFPNPASDIVAIQVEGILRTDLEVTMYDLQGREVRKTNIVQGSTIWHLDTRTLYSGEYVISISDGSNSVNKRVLITR